MPPIWAEIKTKLSGRGLILHHWDTDGICSARLLLDHLEADNITPPLGEYAIPEEIYHMTESYRWVLVVDMAMPEEDLRRLSNLTKVADNRSPLPTSTLRGRPNQPNSRGWKQRGLPGLRMGCKQSPGKSFEYLHCTWHNRGPRHNREG